MRVPQAIRDAVERYDWWGVKAETEAWFQADDRDARLASLARERDELKAKLQKLEYEYADFRGSVNVGIPHQNKKGTGAHYVGRIRRLGRGRAEALIALQDSKAYDYASGMTTDAVARFVRETREIEHIPVAATFDLAHSIGGRLSELLGLGLVQSATNVVAMKDYDEQKFRTGDGRGEQRWFLTAAGMAMVPEEDKDPHEVLLSYGARP